MKYTAQDIARALIEMGYARRDARGGSEDAAYVRPDDPDAEIIVGPRGGLSQRCLVNGRWEDEVVCPRFAARVRERAAAGGPL